MQQSGSLAVALSRHSYSIKEKCKLVQATCTLVSNGTSICRACPLLGLPHKYNYRFKKVVQAADELERNTQFMHYKVNGTARKLHPSCPSILASIHDKLTQFVAVSSRMVHYKACQLLQNL